MTDRNHLARLAALACAAVLTACSSPQPQSEGEMTVPTSTTSATRTVASENVDYRPKVILPDGYEVILELAITNEEKMRGLMYRPSLPEDRGMLFIHEVAMLPTMWMKHTLIALDLIYLDQNGNVVYLVKDAQPCPAEPCPQFTTTEPTRAVLELVSGAASQHGIEVGSQLKFERVPDYPTVDSE